MFFSVLQYLTERAKAVLGAGHPVGGGDDRRSASLGQGQENADSGADHRNQPDSPPYAGEYTNLGSPTHTSTYTNSDSLPTQGRTLTQVPYPHKGVH